MDGSSSIQSLNVANMAASYPSRPCAGDETSEVYHDVIGSNEANSG